MCGRYRLSRYDLLALGIRFVPEPFETFDERPRFQIKPSQYVPIIRTRDGVRIAQVKWGFIPSWAKEMPKIRPINARAETVATSGMYRQAFDHRRCLMPADGFFEWRGTTPPKQPFHIRMKDDSLFAFAGVWEKWDGTATDEPQETCSMITTTPNDVMKPIHNRMPVIVHRADYEKWIDPKVKASDVMDLLRPYEAEKMEAFPVSLNLKKPLADLPGLFDGVEK